MRCFLVESGGALDARLREAAEALGLDVVAAPSAAALGGDGRFTGASRAAVLVPGSGDADVEAALSLARGGGGRAFVAYVADAIAPDDVRRLVRTGSADWFRPDGLETDLREALGRRGEGAPERLAAVVGFLPSKGGAGSTSLAVETAVRLAEKGPRAGAPRTALLDLNLGGGTVADALDLEPRFDVAEIMARPERLDEQLLDAFVSRRSDRLDVFAAPFGRVGPDDVKPPVVFTFLDALATRYDLVLLDLPSVPFPWTENLLLGSDAVAVVGGATVPALRLLAARLAALDALGVPPGRVAAIVNRAKVDFLGRPALRAEVERALPGRRLFFVRRDDAAFDEAADVGRPLLELSPGAGLSRDLQRVAGWAGTALDRHAAEDAARPSGRGRSR